MKGLRRGGPWASCGELPLLLALDHSLSSHSSEGLSPYGRAGRGEAGERRPGSWLVLAGDERAEALKGPCVWINSGGNAHQERIFDPRFH
ncbi:MAG: hypothetical protein CSA62_00635 [Planctomycetota bacterium]|nr:MAG: hypothetical protein CSA62_00635 [Planctomycetota bacterium]